MDFLRTKIVYSTVLLKEVLAINIFELRRWNLFDNVFTFHFFGVYAVTQTSLATVTQGPPGPTHL
jgi:hypothetical protein